MIQDGDVLYFLINGHLMEGKAIDVQSKGDEYFFSIEGYAGCEGAYIISSNQIHRTVFLSAKEALQYQDNPQMYLHNTC